MSNYIIGYMFANSQGFDFSHVNTFYWLGFSSIVIFALASLVLYLARKDIRL